MKIVITATRREFYWYFFSQMARKFSLSLDRTMFRANRIFKDIFLVSLVPGIFVILVIFAS